jgi:hypothetical protein
LSFNNSRISSPHYDSALNRFTAPVAGVYLFMAQVVLTAATSAATVTAAVGKNGTASGNWVSRYIAANVQEKSLARYTAADGSRRYDAIVGIRRQWKHGQLRLHIFCGSEDVTTAEEKTAQ